MYRCSTVKTRITVILLLGVLASGCADTTNSSGNGLVVEEFSISDNTLRPNQEANLQVTLKNYHERPTELNEIKIFNEGSLNVSNRDCTSTEIKRAREGLYPQLSCSWTVKAPGEGFVEGFKSKNTPLKLKVNYSTQFENQKPLKVEFRSLSEIESSETTSVSSSNGEVSLTAETENPAALENPQTISVEVQNNGPGRVDGDYKFDFSPSIVNCDSDTKSPVVDERVEFSCGLESDSEGTRNLFITTSYKYIKSPNLDIQVVNNQ